MAKAKKVRISLYPAERRPSGMLSYTMSIGGREKYPEKTIEARTAAEIVSAAAAFAQEHGQPCHASVMLLEGARKPPGFDAMCHHLYYNLDVAPEAASA
jgi:hypothetical protein